MEKITYKCKKCGWSKDLPAVWGDVKPQYCSNGKCDYSSKKAPKTKKSFRTDPDALKIIRPKKVEKTDEENERRKQEKSEEKRGAAKKGAKRKSSNKNAGDQEGPGAERRLEMEHSSADSSRNTGGLRDTGPKTSVSEAAEGGSDQGG